MVHVDSPLDDWIADDALEPVKSIWAVLHGQKIAFKVTKVDRVKSKHGGKKTDVSFSKLVSAQVRLFAKNFFDSFLTFKDNFCIQFIYVSNMSIEST